MKDKELRDYILETQSEMRTLLNKVEEEKRDLTDEEQSQIDEMKEILSLRKIAKYLSVELFL